MGELYVAIAERKGVPRFFQVYDFGQKAHKGTLERTEEAGDSVALFFVAGYQSSDEANRLIIDVNSLTNAANLSGSLDDLISYARKHNID